MGIPPPTPQQRRRATKKTAGRPAKAGKKPVQTPKTYQKPRRFRRWRGLAYIIRYLFTFSIDYAGLMVIVF